MADGFRMNEKSTRYLLHCFDGGGTTGYATFVIDWSSEIDGSLNRVLRWSSRDIKGSLKHKKDQIQTIFSAQIWGDFHRREVVITERFDLSMLSKDEDILLAVKDNAILEMLCGDYHIPYYEQPREIAKTTATNTRLRHWGFYVEGSPHQRDAVRIGLTFIRRCSNNPKLKEQFFP